MSALNDAIKFLAGTANKDNLHRRVIQATLLDTHGENDAAITEMQMRVSAQEAGVKESYAATDVSAPDAPLSGPSKPTGRKR